MYFKYKVLEKKELKMTSYCRSLSCVLACARTDQGCPMPDKGDPSQLQAPAETLSATGL